jgi:hypothetical protein
MIVLISSYTTDVWIHFCTEIYNVRYIVRAGQEHKRGTFHLYVATFQQHLHTEYISLSSTPVFSGVRVTQSLVL